MSKTQSGVTLLELMIVVVIVGILASVAIPSYRNHVLRANRTEGKTALMQAASTLERCYTRSNTYVGCLALPFNSQDGHYQIQADAANGGVTQNSFALQAVPQGTQAQDAGCGNLQLNSQNQRRVSGSKGPAECWGK